MAREPGSAVIPGEVNAIMAEALSCWEEAGYESKAEAMKAAVRLWRALYDQAFFKSKPICENFIRSPKVFLMAKYLF